MGPSVVETIPAFQMIAVAMKNSVYMEALAVKIPTILVILTTGTL